MKFCFYISRRLAAYCEGQVSPDERAHIAVHLDECAVCRARAERISERVHLMRHLPPLEPADELWSSIARELSVSRSPESVRVISPVRRLGFGLRRARRPVAIAAAVVIIATALLLANRYGPLQGSRQGELNLAGYLDLVSTVALAEPALKEFPAAPGFTEVRWPEAKAAVNFPVIAPESLPNGYRLMVVRQYTTGDLRALQFKYRSEQDGVCVFQLPASSNLSFGERPSEQYKADGVHCRRTSSKTCSAYRFVLGGTQFVLMMRQTDPAMAAALIKAFYAEYAKTQ